MSDIMESKKDTKDVAKKDVDLDESAEEESKSLSADATFLLECFKHLQTPAMVNVQDVAALLNYKNPASVSNRINRLKKKFEIQITCCNAASNANNGGAATGPGRKGAKATRGPIKAKPAATGDTPEEEPVEPAKTTKKPGRKPAAKAATKTKKGRGKVSDATIAATFKAEIAKADAEKENEA